MNEIIAAIVGAVVTAIIALIAYLYTSRQGNRIIVKRLSETPQIKISEEVKKNLKITYNDQPVDNLVLNTLVFYNQGNEIIEPVEINLKVKPSNGEITYLETEEDDPLDQTKLVRFGDQFIIQRPYINPKKKFKEEEIRLAVFSNTALDFSVEGGGKGWYAKFEEEEGGYIRFMWTRVLPLLFLPALAMLVLLQNFSPTNTILIGLAVVILAVSILSMIDFSAMKRD